MTPPQIALASLLIASPISFFLYASGVRGWRFVRLFAGFILAGAAVLSVLILV